MTSDPSLIERQMADVELRPFTLDEFHRRRHRQQRHRRIATAVLAVVLVGASIGGALYSLDGDDESVDTDLVGPPPSPFEGRWTSIDADGSSQTLEVRRGEAGDYEVALHDDSAAPCSDGPSTESGRGQLRSATELVTALELTCDDQTASAPADLARLTFVHDPDADELTDDIGVVWRREGRSDDGDRALVGPSPFEGSWVVSEEGQYFPDSLEIRIVDDEDLHEAVMRKAETPQCGGGASTMQGTGRREVSAPSASDLARLAVVVDLTCDDGSTPIPQAPVEEGRFVDLAITYTHDPETDELVGSLGSTFVRRDAAAP